MNSPSGLGKFPLYSPNCLEELFSETQRPEGIQTERAKTAHEEVASYKREMSLQH